MNVIRVYLFLIFLVLNDFFLLLRGQMDALILIRSTLLLCVVECDSPVTSRIVSCCGICCLNAYRNTSQS